MDSNKPGSPPPFVVSFDRTPELGTLINLAEADAETTPTDYFNNWRNDPDPPRALLSLLEYNWLLLDGWAQHYGCDLFKAAISDQRAWRALVEFRRAVLMLLEELNAVLSLCGSPDTIRIRYQEQGGYLGAFDRTSKAHPFHVPAPLLHSSSAREAIQWAKDFEVLNNKGWKRRGGVQAFMRIAEIFDEAKADMIHNGRDPIRALGDPKSSLLNLPLPLYVLLLMAEEECLWIVSQAEAAALPPAPATPPETEAGKLGQGGQVPGSATVVPVLLQSGPSLLRPPVVVAIPEVPESVKAWLRGKLVTLFVQCCGEAHSSQRTTAFSRGLDTLLKGSPEQ